MSLSSSTARIARRRCVVRALAVGLLLLQPVRADADSSVAAGAVHSSADDALDASAGEWGWPVHPFQLVRAFVAPPHPYGSGHRGIDLLPPGGSVVLSPSAGVVAFSGQVAGRGVVTVDHGGGLVSTFEPVDPVVAAGARVERATPLGTPSVGGHAEPGAVHVGVRLDGEYINPLLLLGGVPRAVLLPCC